MGNVTEIITKEIINKKLIEEIVYGETRGRSYG